MNLRFFLFLILAPLCAQAATYTVTSTADTGAPGTLRWAIEQANADPGSTINIQNNLGTLTLTDALPFITAAVTIDGGMGNTVSGGGQYRIFFVKAGSSSVTIANLTLADGYAHGGNGGLGGGGGGLGAGAAVFADEGNVTLQGVQFSDNAALGGNGASGNGRYSGGPVSFPLGGGGGGGGLQGNGGDAFYTGAGGGGGFYGNGGSSWYGSGGGGGITGNGGAGGDTAGGGGGGTGDGGYGGDSSQGGAAGIGGGAQGGGTYSNGGGGGSPYGSGGLDGGWAGGGGGGAGGTPVGPGAGVKTNGGNGGRFGGGGGGTPLQLGYSAGGDGGFGGGGGGGGYSGAGGVGGFGGGGGGLGFISNINSISGAAGGAFGGKAGDGKGFSGGGGGAALGAAVFASPDATLTFIDASADAGSLTGGAGGPGTGSNFSANFGRSGAAGGTAGSAFFLSGPTTFQVNNGTQTITGSIADASPYLSDPTAAGYQAGRLIKTGGGMLVLLGSNSYGGGTSLEGGVLMLGSSGAIGDSGTISFNGGTLRYTGSNTTDYSARFSQAANQQYLIDTNGQNVTFASDLSSAGGSLSKLGAGVLTLTGSSTFDGVTTIASGTLAVSGALTSASWDIGSSSAAGVVVDGGHIGNTNGTIVLGATAGGAGSLTLSSGTVDNSGLPNYGSFAIGQTGQGNLTITGGNLTSVTTYLGVSGNGSATITGGTWNSGNLFGSAAGGQGTLLIQGGFMSSSAVFLGYGGQSTATVSGGTWNSASLSLGAYGLGNLQVSGGVVSTGTVGFADFSVGGAGTLTLSGTSGNRGTLSAARLVKGPGSATLDFNGGILQAAANESDFISGMGTTIQSGGAFLDSNGFSIGIASAFTGTGGLTKLGTGTVTLSGISNFAGALTLNEGVLAITGRVTSGATSGIATSGADASLIVTGSGANWTSLSDALIGHNSGTGYLTITGGATVGDTFALVGRSAGGAGHVTVTGPGSTWTHSAGLVIGTGGLGTMHVENGGQVGNADGTIGGDPGSHGSVRVTGTGSQWTSSSYLVVGNAGSGTLSVDAGGVVRVGASGSGMLTLGHAGASEGTLNIGAAAGQAAVAAGTVQASAVIGGSGSGTKVVNFNHTNSAYTFAPNLTGSLSVRQNGGATTLTGSNSYTGGTIVSGGTLSFASDINLGAASAGLTMNGGTLRNTTDLITGRQLVLASNSSFHVADGYLTFLTGFSGTGGLTKTGGNYLTLTGAQTYTGATIVQDGHLKLENGSLASSSVALAAGTNFYLADSDGVFGANITGSGTFHRGGSGESILTGSVAAGVTTQIESGTLQIGNGGTIGSLAGDVIVNGALSVNRSDTVTLAGTISGNGSFFQLGGGTTILTGSNTYLGETIISAGTLAVNGSLAGDVLVQNGGTLGGDGVLGGGVTVQSGGVVSPGNSPGQITLSDSLTMEDGSFLLIEIGGTDEGFYDQLDVQGYFTAGGTLNLMLVDGFAPLAGASFQIFNGAMPGYEAGSFTLATNLGGGLSWDTDALASDGIVTVVPEPGTLGLMMGGVALLLAARRRGNR